MSEIGENGIEHKKVEKHYGRTRYGKRRVVLGVEVLRGCRGQGNGKVEGLEAVGGRSSIYINLTIFKSIISYNTF